MRLHRFTGMFAGGMTEPGEAVLGPRPKKRPARIRDANRDRALTDRVVLATLGLGLVLAAVAVAGRLGVLSASSTTLLFAASTTLQVQAVVWVVGRLELSRRLSWDPRYVLVPLVAVAALLALYGFLFPEARALTAAAWLPALLLGAGDLRASQLVGVSVVALSMQAAAAILAVSSGGASLGLADYLTAAVFVVGVPASAVLLDRIRRDRERERTVRSILRLDSATDPSTGLPSRREFERQLERELARASRRSVPCTVALLHVDLFLNVHGQASRAIGESVSQKVAETLAAQVRKCEYLCRYDGQAFALLMPETPAGVARSVMERMCDGVESCLMAGASIVPVHSLRISLGLATYPDHGATRRSLLAHADRELTQDWSGGGTRNRIA